MSATAELLETADNRLTVVKVVADLKETMGKRFQFLAVTDTVDVGDGPQTVAADPSIHTAWVINFTANSISVIQR